MSDLRQTLNKVLGGSAPPEEFLKAVEEFLADPKANIDALRSVVDAAEQLGLDEKTAKAARERIAIALEGHTEVIGDDPKAGGFQEIGDPTAMADDDATEITGSDSDKTEITTGSEATHLRAEPDPDRTVAADDDRTEQVQTGDEDRTVVTGDDRTEQADGGAAAADPFAMASPPPPPGDELGPGSVLKQRFRLEEVIGQGGMGAVYKAVDLLKVEARDRNPYIAVKLLVGDFKEHPEAFIALQRESAKAQRLAHPNIATVYDFDRDGETVYMTMELMIGAELAKYIKKLPAGGLPVPDAMKIIEQLCAGLEYAHGRGLVHSDFKPGNAFVLEDGTVKLLDFGIARASKTKTDAEGESTVFDPGQLGALTPAYATIEMFEGEDPDPRDDLYALACVSYELFTGKHPFNKMSAVKAKEKGLKPAPVQKLNKRQNKALLKGLALHRKDRIESVEAFWDGIKPRKDYTLQIAAAATAGILLIGALSYGPVVDFMHEREYAELVTEIESGDEQRLVGALERIDALPEERMREAAARAQARIVAYHEARADELVNHDEGLYNYADALAEMDKLNTYFPDSNTVAQVRNRFEGQRDELLRELGTRFETSLEAGTILPNPDVDDITDVVAILRQVQPEHDLLNDARLVGEYRTLVDQFVAQNNWERADDILDVGLDYSPEAPTLLDLRDTVSAELRRREEAELVAQLQGQLRGQRPTSVAGFREILEPLAQLRQLRGEDPLVRGLESPLADAVSSAVDAAGDAGDWAEADSILAEFAPALPMDALIAQRTALSARQREAGYDAGAERASDVSRRIAAIRSSLADANFDDAFDRDLTARFKELTARVGTDLSAWETLRGEIATAHIERAQALGAENRYSAAQDTLESGQRFHQALPDFASVGEQLASARQEYQAEVARQEALAAVEAGKGRVIAAARADRAPEAMSEFDNLREQLPADDPFITTEGPQAIAGMYERLARSAGEADNYTQAVNLARAGLDLVPGSEALQELMGEYQSLADRQAVVQAASANDLTAANFGAFRNRYQQVRQGLSGADATAFERDVVAALAQRMTALDGANRLREANELRAIALQLFPGNQRITQLRLREPEAPSEYAPRIAAAIESNELTAATTLLAEANREERGHSELSRFPQLLQQSKAEAQRFYTEFRTAMNRGDRNSAQNALTRALQLWTDNPEYLDAQRQNFQVTTAEARADDGSQPCTASLAGHGKQGRAACFDMPGGETGPRMVVVEGVSGGQPFAIGKYEVAVDDWNKYCRLSGACTERPAGERALPVTGVSIQQADAYIAWLSEQTGKRYRIPTDAEWRHAAGGGGDPGDSGQFNCRVTQAGNVIKGHSLQSIASGSDNGWGLRNHVGNAQEWTRDGGTLRARGGAFEDSLSDCGIDLVEPHSGAADAVTSFRVARGID